MRRWPWITALTLSVLAVHGAGLWALHVYHGTAAPQPSAWHARLLPLRPDAQGKEATKPATSAEVASPEVDKPAVTAPATTKPVVTLRLAPLAPFSATPAPQTAVALKAPTQAAAGTQPPTATVNTVKTAKTLNSAPPTIAPSDLAEKSPTVDTAATNTSDTTRPVTAGKPLNPTARTDQAANNSTSAKDTPEKTIRADARLDADHADTQYRHPYPALSKKLAEEGAVLLHVVVDAQGKPVSAAVVQSSGYARLDDAGQHTVMRWRFKPATVNGVPEAQSTVLQAVKFRLSTEASSP